ncbi:uncharacterized protein LOC135694600 [Rhopilema esculentum]|uniref:uncharacterized protein LOC135694600 n=1 Tax=Rhopilema esculentum TaxID=499914 RepID=UPI0031D0FC16
MERLWSYLRQFTAITKEMTPSHRIDLLSDALIYFAQKKNSSIEWSLSDRLSKAKSVLKSSQAELQQIFDNLGDRVEDSEVYAWHDREKSLALARTKGKKAESDWTMKYVQKLLDIETASTLYKQCTTSDQMVNVKHHINELDKELKSIERARIVTSRWSNSSPQFSESLRKLEDDKKVGLLAKARIEAVERIFHLSLKKRYSAGQKIPKQIEKQIKRANGRLTTTVKKYNDCDFKFRDSRLPNTSTFNDVKDPECQLYDDINEDVEGASQSFLPSSQKKKIVTLTFLRDRAAYESQLVEKDFNTLTAALTEKLCLVKKAIQNIEAEFQDSGRKTSFGIGSSSLLWKKAIRMEKRIEHCRNLFGNDDHENVVALEGDETEEAYDYQVNLLDDQTDYEDTLTEQL